MTLSCSEQVSCGNKEGTEDPGIALELEKSFTAGWQSTSNSADPSDTADGLFGGCLHRTRYGGPALWVVAIWVRNISKKWLWVKTNGTILGVGEFRIHHPL